MSGFAGSIIDLVKKERGYDLIYPPGIRLELGDVLEKSAGIWVPVGNLAKDLGIPVNAKDDPTLSDWEPVSQGGYDIQVKLAGKPAAGFTYLADAEAGVKLTLKGENAFVLSLSGIRLSRIESIDGFWNEVKERRGFWTWDLSRRIVTRVFRCESATFLANGTSEAAFELSAQADLQAGAVSLASLSAGFALRSTMASADRFVARGDTTPLFGVHRVKTFGGFGPASAPTGRLDETELQDADEV